MFFKQKMLGARQANTQTQRDRARAVRLGLRPNATDAQVRRYLDIFNRMSTFAHRLSRPRVSQGFNRHRHIYTYDINEVGTRRNSDPAQILEILVQFAVELTLINAPFTATHFQLILRNTRTGQERRIANTTVDRFDANRSAAVLESVIESEDVWELDDTEITVIVSNIP